VTGRVLVTLSGARQPIVAVLLLISFFTFISGKPLDGLLLGVVATALAADAGQTGRQSPDQPERPSAWRARSGPPALRLVAAGLGAALIYAVTVGSFSRYSWPATAAVVGVGAGVVILGWGGPVRQRTVPPKFSRAAALVWAGLLVAAGGWELAALLMQPSIEVSSYAHPTISTLTDPLLASGPGRAVALLAWLAIGAYLVER